MYVCLFLKEQGELRLCSLFVTPCGGGAQKFFFSLSLFSVVRLKLTVNSFCSPFIT